MKVYRKTVEPYDYVVIDEDKIERNAHLCNCYDEFGQKIGCYDAGCYTAETADNFDSELGEAHTEVDVYEYHDGHNFCTLIVGYDNDPINSVDLAEIDEDLNHEILEHYEKADWGEWENGICTGLTDKYEFTKSQWQGSYGYADVIKR